MAALNLKPYWDEFPIFFDRDYYPWDAFPLSSPEGQKALRDRLCPATLEMLSRDETWKLSRWQELTGLQGNPLRSKELMDNPLPADLRNSLEDIMIEWDNLHGLLGDILSFNTHSNASSLGEQWSTLADWLTTQVFGDLDVHFHLNNVYDIFLALVAEDAQTNMRLLVCFSHNYWSSLSVVYPRSISVSRLLSLHLWHRCCH